MLGCITISSIIFFDGSNALIKAWYKLQTGGIGNVFVSIKKKES